MYIATTPSISSLASQAAKPGQSTPATPQAQPSRAQEDTVALQGERSAEPSGLMDVVYRAASAVPGVAVGGMGTLVSSPHFGPEVLPIVARSSDEVQGLTGAAVKTPSIGTDSKVMTAVLLPFAGVAAIVLYGLSTGFYHIGQAIGSAGNDVKK